MRAILRPRAPISNQACTDTVRCLRDDCFCFRLTYTLLSKVVEQVAFACPHSPAWRVPEGLPRGLRQLVAVLSYRSALPMSARACLAWRQIVRARARFSNGIAPNGIFGPTASSYIPQRSSESSRRAVLGKGRWRADSYKFRAPLPGKDLSSPPFLGLRPCERRFKTSDCCLPNMRRVFMLPR
jgi:hypothetical protein